MMTTQTLALTGVPSSAGGNCPGMEKTPAHLRRLQLAECLSAAGVALQDYGDLPLFPFRVDADRNAKVRNVDLVASCAAAVRDRTSEFLSAGERFLLIGGDCTITVGVVAALANADQSFGILYIDGHLDLNDPDTWFSGIMDGTGVAHLLGYGCDQLKTLCQQEPMITPDQLTYLGPDPSRIEPAEQEILNKHGIDLVTVDAVQADPTQSFEDAAKTLASFDRVLVHVDIDVLHFPTFPIAHVPEYGKNGLAITELAT